MPRKHKGYFMISVVAEQYDVHPQTLRLYEREGFLKPSRTEGNTRLYSEKDLETLSFILSLTRDLGVNLAGVEVVMNMRRRLETMQAEMDRFIESLRDEVGRRRMAQDEELSQALVKVARPGRIIKVEKG
jgi:MerR family transcriptional regulator/heat shock protein HspR